MLDDGHVTVVKRAGETPEKMKIPFDGLNRPIYRLHVVYVPHALKYQFQIGIVVTNSTLHAVG